MAPPSDKANHDGCNACTCRDQSSWQVLSEDDLERVNRARRTRRYEPGDTVFAQGEDDRCVYCVKAGTIAERRLDAEGNSVLLGLNYASDLVGYRSFLNGGTHRTSAEAVTQATVCVIDAAVVGEVMDKTPELTREFLRRSTAEVEQAQDTIFRSATLSNRDRLLQLLQELMRRHGTMAADGSCRIDLPVSRRDIASMIGVRHETLSRIIGRLEAEGLARFSGRHVTVASPRALAAAASQRSAD
jgi:CRP/FNR family transcriptional regulator